METGQLREIAPWGVDTWNRAACFVEAILKAEKSILIGRNYQLS